MAFVVRLSCLLLLILPVSYEMIAADSPPHKRAKTKSTPEIRQLPQQDSNQEYISSIDKILQELKKGNLTEAQDLAKELTLPLRFKTAITQNLQTGGRDAQERLEKIKGLLQQQVPFSQSSSSSSQSSSSSSLSSPSQLSRPLGESSSKDAEITPLEAYTELLSMISQNPIDIDSVRKKLTKFNEDGKLDGANAAQLMAWFGSGKTDQLKNFIDQKIKVLSERGLKEAESPYTLRAIGGGHSQPEERWRWRANFKVSIYDDDTGAFMESMDFHPIHQESNGILNAILKILPQDDKSNILVPSITIIYESKDGQNAHVSSFLENLINPGKYVVFFSKLSGFYGSQHLTKENKIFQFLAGQNLRIDADSIKHTMRSFYHSSKENPLEDNVLGSFKTKMLAVLATPEESLGTNLGTYFYHSEQWFISYLSGSYLSEFNTNRLNLSTIMGNLILRNKDKIKKIKKVIFHLHSKHDICDICSPTLSIFLDNLNKSTQQIANLITEFLGEKDGFGIEVSKNLGFFMIASSVRSDLSQAKFRQHYTSLGGEELHARRREHFGLDSLSASDEPTLFKGGMPYCYIQVQWPE